MEFIVTEFVFTDGDIIVIARFEIVRIGRFTARTITFREIAIPAEIIDVEYVAA